MKSPDQPRFTSELTGAANHEGMTVVHIVAAATEPEAVREVCRCERNPAAPNATVESVQNAPAGAGSQMDPAEKIPRHDSNAQMKGLTSK